MRVLITGGAGFVGSHLADALLAAGHEVTAFDNLSTGSIDNIEHLKAHPRFRYTIESVAERAAAGRADRPLRRRLPPGRGGRREEDRGRAGAHDREQRARHRGRAAPRQQEEAAGGGGVDVGGLRQERRRAVPRGRRPGDGPDLEAPLGLRLQQGDRRVPGARLLEGKEAAGDRHPALQHRRAAPDRPVRHGDPDVRPPGARRAADHGVRRRHAAAQLHLRRRRGRRADRG